MNSQQILEELLEILKSQNVEIREESMGGSTGGMCKIKGKYAFYFDRTASKLETAANCARAINKLIDIEMIYLRPEIREFIEANPAEKD